MYSVLESWFQDPEVQQFLQVNRYQDVLWFNCEAFERWLWWMLLVAVVDGSADPHRPAATVAREIAGHYEIIRQLRRRAQESGYQVERLLELVRGGFLN